MALGDWTLTVTGEIVRVDTENIDKSGRNPRYLVSFIVRPDKVEAPPEARLAAEIQIDSHERDLAKLTPTPPRAGDRVTMRAQGNGPQPAVFLLTSVERQ